MGRFAAMRREKEGRGKKKSTSREGGAKCMDYIGKSLWGEAAQLDFRVEGRACQPYHVKHPEGCWENLEARCTVIC